MAKRKTYGRKRDDDNDSKALTPDEKFIQLAIKRWKLGQDADRDQLERENEALRFAAGEEWPEQIKVMRAGQDAGNGLPAVPAKPCLTLRSILDPINQLIGTAQDSDLGFELVPADDFEELIGPIDATEIKLREGLVRRIQRTSEAIDARMWGFDRGMKCGRGYWGVMTRYAEGKTRDQDVFVQRIYNQNGVTLDPSSEQPDGSDAGWGFGGDDIVPWDEYEDLYPEAADGSPNTVIGLDDSAFRALGNEIPKWFTVKKGVRYCRIANYYYTETKPRVLCTMNDGTLQWKDELPKDAEYDETLNRSVLEKTVKWAKIDGKNKLEEADWPSPYIPIIKYVGRELQPFDNEKRYEGIVQPAMDSARGEDYMLSALVWQIGLAPVPQIMMAGGQDEGFEAEYMAMTTRSLPVLHYNQTDFVGRPAPPPFRTPTNTEIGPMATAIAMFKQSFQAATESHGPSHGEADPALRSGKAISAVVAADQHGSSNYITNWARSVEYEGRIINSLLYPIYGARPGRIARILDPDNNQESVMIGKHYTMQGQGKLARPVAAPNQEAPPLDAKKYTLTKDAKFNCVVKVTKKFETRRQEEAAIIGQIISADPEHAMAVMGDLFFKYQDGPGHDEIAERYKVMLDPKVQAMLQAKAQGQNIPAPVQQQIMALQKSNQEKDGIIKQAQQVIQTDQAKYEYEMQKAKLQADKDIQIAHMNNAAKIEVARISAAKQAADPGAEADEELLATGIQHAQENFAAEADHQRELEQMVAQHALDTSASAQDHQQQMEQGAQQHAQALQQGQQANDNAMQQNEQTAALQPPPQPAGEPNAE